MIGIDMIRVTKHETSKLELANVKKLLEEKVKAYNQVKVYSSWYDKEKEEVQVTLSRPITLDQIHKIIHGFQVERIIIKKFSWQAREVGPIRRGVFNVIVS